MFNHLLYLLLQHSLYIQPQSDCHNLVCKRLSYTSQGCCLKSVFGIMNTSFLLITPLRKADLSVWACLGVNPLDMPRNPYWASEGKHSQQPTMFYHPILTSSSVHFINLINGLHCFYRITLSLSQYCGGPP